MRKTQSLFRMMRKRPRGQHSFSAHSGNFQVQKVNCFVATYLMMLMSRMGLHLTSKWSLHFQRNHFSFRLGSFPFNFTFTELSFKTWFAMCGQHLAAVWSVSNQMCYRMVFECVTTIAMILNRKIRKLSNFTWSKAKLSHWRYLVTKLLGLSRS